LTEITLRTSAGTCRIIQGGALEDLPGLVPEGARTAIITDTTVGRLYGDRFPRFVTAALRPGERTKTLRTVESLHRRFLEWEMDRSSFVVGIGGGIVCDIAGFAASTYMRGVRFGFVPTTLLAQADAAIGGKNGVNVGGIKNIAGVFSQPDFVLEDFSFLKTLPRRERLCGLAEIMKHALIADRDMFERLDGEAAALLDLEPGAVERALVDSVRIKSAIVTADVKESGERRLLNFGHTLGHAVEKEAGLAHGEAVAIGMAAAALISARRGMISRAEAEQVIGLLRASGLPVRIPVSAARLLKTMKKDKKRQNGLVHFILLSAIGRACDVEMGTDELEGILHDLCQHS
jgi:3-dehydroquinate synthase